MKEQTLADYDANEARAFDSNMVNNLNTNEAAKQGAAAALGVVFITAGAGAASPVPPPGVKSPEGLTLCA